MSAPPRRQSPPLPQLSLGSHLIQVVRSAKLLGVTVNDQLTWKIRVTVTVRSTAYRLYMLLRLNSLGTPADELKGIYCTSPLSCPDLCMPHLCGHPPPPPLNSNNWKMSKGGHAGTSLALPTQTTIMPYLPTLAARHRAALVRLGRGLLRNPRLRHLLPPPLTRNSQPMPHATQTWSHHLEPRGPTVTNTVRFPPW
ncbi:hypothetical protein E2C01_042600 [Portunus trituberculatus]|uniref:Uncharacterized protein n=1 Tax=Portunus trituberculatus TaxID=210409 RepID=A0A5B7FTV9_PORTR|nr:hypothetical protein [Portunus trituberculatus]